MKVHLCRFGEVFCVFFSCVIFILAGCGGGGGGGGGSDTPPVASVTLSGQALGGAPVKGYVYVKDGGGQPEPASAKIAADGSFTLSLDAEWQSPLFLWTDGYVNGRPAKLFSQVSLAADQTTATVNINPLTTAVVCAAMGKPAAEVVPKSAVIPTQATVDTITNHLKTNLADLWTAFSAPAGFDPFTSGLTLGQGVDQLFDLFDLEADARGAIHVTSRHDAAVAISMDSAGSLSGDLSAAAAQATADQAVLAQMREAFEKEYELFSDSIPSQAVLESELKPYFAPGYLNSGETYDSFAAAWADDEDGVVGYELISLSIHRPMQEQTYGDQTIHELADNYDEGLWVLLSVKRNGIVRTYPTSFVNIGGGEWKVYGNRREIASSSMGRAAARKNMRPGGALEYATGFNFYHRDHDDTAFSKGITKLAIVNPALPPTPVDGQTANCVQMARRDDGANERYGITSVSGESGTWLRHRGGIGYDHDNLLFQDKPEFVVFALNDANQVQGVWIYVVEALPFTIDKVIEKDSEWFADIQEPASFEDITIPGSNHLSWDLPSDEAIYPSWLWFGWDDADWNYSEVSVDNPAWVETLDFYDWLEEDVEAAPHSGIVRQVHLGLGFGSALDDRYYVVQRTFDPFTDQIIQSKNDAVEMSIDHSWADTNLSDRLTGVLQPTGANVTRLETTVTVESATTNGEGVEAQAYIQLAYQPDEIWDQPGWSDEKYFDITVRMNYRDGRMWLLGWVWGSQNEDGSVEYDLPPPEGDYPFDETIVFNREYSIAVECDPAARTLSFEFNGQGSTVDMSGISDFDPADFKRAQLRVRVRYLENPGDSGAITVKYDNVKINGELYDDFDDGLAPNKWRAHSYE
jgi:hypothetical protein